MLSSAVVVLAASMVVGQVDQPKVPKEVLESLGYYIGTWRAEWKENGDVHTFQFTAKWAPGEHCTILNTRAKGPDGVSEGTLLSGWDLLKKQVVDTSYGSDGSFSIERWTIVSPQVEEATSTGANANGKPTSSTYRIEKKGPDNFIQTVTNRKEGGESKPDMVLDYKKVAPAETPAKKKRNKVR